MYAEPSKQPSTTKTLHDAIHNPQTTTKPPTKLVQYKRGKGPAPAVTSAAPVPPVALSVANTPQPEPTVADEAADVRDTVSVRSYLAPNSQRGAWSSQRLFGQDTEDTEAVKEDQHEDLDGIAGSEDNGEDSIGKYSADEHPLCFSWSFWFMHRAPGQKISDYEAAMTKIATFATVETFWAVYSHLKRADQVPTITDYHMFRAGVRPVWEDPVNINGGKWMIRLKKGLTARLWERLAIAVVGNAFEVADEICGIVLSIRNSEDIISLWNRTALDTKANFGILNTMKQVMGLPSECVLEYKAHNDSLRDSSSFRNTGIYTTQ
ncbi:hypothetical protein H4S08_002290 [Coemansia sp. RSA 1365]|nr:hypothetical protein H4S08_002290 [Coemansia sp. RSA 1365]